MKRSKVVGASKLRRKLRRMPDDITKGVKSAVEDTAELVKFNTLKRVPVDEGDLAASLHAATRGDKLTWRIGYWKKGNRRRWEKAGWRAIFTEFGTRGYAAGSRRDDGSKSGKRVNRNIPPRPAKPFLGPALRASRRQGIVWIERAVNKAIRRASR